MPFHSIDAALARIVIPPLPLLVVGVHHPLHRALMRGENSRGAEHGVDERGLAVIDVRDQSNVTERGVRHGRGMLLGKNRSEKLACAAGRGQR